MKCLENCGMKLLIHSKTSTAAAFNGSIVEVWVLIWKFNPHIIMGVLWHAKRNFRSVTYKRTFKRHARHPSPNSILFVGSVTQLDFEWAITIALSWETYIYWAVYILKYQNKNIFLSRSPAVFVRKHHIPKGYGINVIVGWLTMPILIWYWRLPLANPHKIYNRSKTLHYFGNQLSR